MRKKLFDNLPKSLKLNGGVWLRIFPDRGDGYRIYDPLEGREVGRILFDEAGNWVYGGNLLSVEEQEEAAGPAQGTFNEEELRGLFINYRGRWNLPAAMTAGKFIEALQEEGIVLHGEFDFGIESYSFYYLPGKTLPHLACQTIPQSYLSHSSALLFWGLSESGRKEIIYINQEQTSSPAKSKKGTLTQAGIDRAFSLPQRVSGSSCKCGKAELILLKGKFTEHAGVEEIKTGKKNIIRVTGIERTMIDCAVRPAYAGGAQNVLKAFQKAKQSRKISVAKLAELLTKLDYTYPYHQAIGFYLEAAGNYTPEEIRIFKSRTQALNFYLDYQMEDPEYSPDWKIYYPAELVI